VPAILRETSEGTSNSTVRLVFRPYTQFRRTNCTSVSLRASSRISSAFALIRHSSLSFGSHRTSSLSNSFRRKNRTLLPRGRATLRSSAAKGSLHFHCALAFCTQKLACMIDSLVRVSRRVYESHFVRIAKVHAQNRPSTQITQPAGLCPPDHAPKQGPIRADLRRTLSPQRGLKQADDITGGL